MMYIMIFASAIKLRYTQPDTPRAYKIPGGNYGMWIVAGMGIARVAVRAHHGLHPAERRQALADPDLRRRRCSPRS